MPKLPENFIPFIGQQFSSYKEAYDFYNTYAKHTGFGIKKGQTNRNRRYLRCVCEGKHISAVADGDRQRDKLSKRTGCRAFMRLKERDDGSCVVKDINVNHNHKLVLTPSMLVFLRSHKKVDPTLKEYIKDPLASNVKHVNVMSLLSRIHNGRANLPFHDKDVLNMYVLPPENLTSIKMIHGALLYFIFEDLHTKKKLIYFAGQQHLRERKPMEQFQNCSSSLRA